MTIKEPKISIAPMVKARDSARVAGALKRTGLPQTAPRRKNAWAAFLLNLQREWKSDSDGPGGGPGGGAGTRNAQGVHERPRISETWMTKVTQ
jgi:hypothetical protein